jgi:hypothetical protein
MDSFRRLAVPSSHRLTGCTLRIVAVSGDAVLAVGGTLGGTALGFLGSLLVWRLGHSEREQQWRRDQQIAAYSELVAAGVEIARACTLARVAETADEFAEAQREITATVIRSHNATHRARIVASEAVRPYVDQLAELNQAATNEFTKKEPDEASIDQSLAGAAAVRDLISEQAREDFKFGRNRWLRRRR